MEDENFSMIFFPANHHCFAFFSFSDSLSLSPSASLDSIVKYYLLLSVNAWDIDENQKKNSLIARIDSQTKTFGSDTRTLSTCFFVFLCCHCLLVFRSVQSNSRLKDFKSKQLLSLFRFYNFLAIVASFTAINVCNFE